MTYYDQRDVENAKIKAPQLNEQELKERIARLKARKTQAELWAKSWIARSQIPSDSRNMSKGVKIEIWEAQNKPGYMDGTLFLYGGDKSYLKMADSEEWNETSTTREKMFHHGWRKLSDEEVEQIKLDVDKMPIYCGYKQLTDDEKREESLKTAETHIHAIGEIQEVLIVYEAELCKR